MEAALHYALGIAPAANCYKVMLLASSRDPGAHGFYEQAGFRKDVKTGYVAYPAS